MCASRNGACREGQRAFSLGDLSATAGSPARDFRVGLRLQNRGVRLAQTEPESKNVVLRHGLLDAEQCGGMPFGDARTPETAG